MKICLKNTLIIIIFILLIIFTFRIATPREIDDLHPLNHCEQEYIQKSDILWIIPRYLNTPISENKTWCKKILKLNKTLGMHGIYHSYHEFKYPINETELIEAKGIFKDCFGYEPTLFKPPYLRLSNENKKILENNNLTIKRFANQNLHKVYHCQNTGVLPNWFHDIF